MFACFKSATCATRTLVLPFLLAIVGLPFPAAASAPDGIVYVRVPRSTTMLQTSEGRVDASFLDTLPEVHYIKGNFNAPGQLVWRHTSGNGNTVEDIIYDCLNHNPEHPGPPVQDKDTCVPMDPAVSYDGKKVAFAVYHGYYYKRFQTVVPPGSGEEGKLYHYYGSAHPSWAGIYIYEFETGTLTAWPHSNHVWDTAPVWLPNGKIMFSSTRANIWAKWVTGSVGRPQQLWIANADGSAARNVDPHDQQNALHPFVHSSGRVFYSSHQTNKVRMEVTSAGGDGQTPNNLWWLMSTDLRGGDLNAHLHAHYFKWTGINDITLTALHFLGERSSGDMCSDMYYRRNNFGAGKIICWHALTANEDPKDDRSPLGHEGPYPFKSTQGYYAAVNGDSGDSGGIRPGGGFDPSVHARDPAGLPGDQLLFAAGLGEHSNCHWAKLNVLAVYTTDGFTCDMGIYKTTRIPVRTSSAYGYGTADTEVVINRPQWHEIMPKPVMPYSEIYGEGTDKPFDPPVSNTDDSNTSYGIFASTNAFTGDLKAYPSSKTTEEGLPLPGNEDWAGPAHPEWCAQQGCVMQALVHRPGAKYENGDLEGEIKALRFWETIPNSIRHSNQNPLLDIWGQKLKLLGDVALEPDGSFKVKLPADTPFLMAGIDAKGRVIARHQQPMSLRPGEKQICSGCHLHSTTDGENALNPFAATDAGQIADRNAPALALPQGYPRDMPEFTANIYSMLKANCGSCHGGSQGSHAPILTASPAQVYRTLLNDMLPVGGLKTDKTRDSGEQSQPVALPWMTRYVNVFFARESLLYWKAVGQRTDGRSDNTRDDDFDYGTEQLHAHNALSDADLHMLANWIDTGAYRDPTATVDIIFQDGFGP